jgi:hypothetical protein
LGFFGAALQRENRATDEQYDGSDASDPTDHAALLNGANRRRT